ncbi:hypothetical protein AAMO2058_000224300 [Amorphochlora amoebiformis]
MKTEKQGKPQASPISMPPGYFMRKLNRQDLMSETKSLKRVDPFKIIRVKEGQDVYEFAVSDKMAIDYLRMMMKERIRANELARIKAEKGDNAQLEHDPLANKLLTFVWRGRPLKDTVHDVVAGETIMLFITKALKKANRSVCHGFLACACGRF